MIGSERLAILLVVLGAASRLMHLPPNIAAVAGVTLLAGYAIEKWWLAVLVPVGAMALADIFLGWYPGMLFTYVGMVAAVFYARAFLNPLDPLRLVGVTFLASLTFFLLSNFGVWASGFYGYTLDGLVACFVAAVPFWQHSLIGDFVSTALAFGLFLLARRTIFAASAKA